MSAIGDREERSYYARVLRSHANHLASQVTSCVLFGRDEIPVPIRDAAEITHSLEEAIAYLEKDLAA